MTIQPRDYFLLFEPSRKNSFQDVEDCKKELLQMHAWFVGLDEKDELISILKWWHKGFLEALSIERNVEKVSRVFTCLLRDALKDPRSLFQPEFIQDKGSLIQPGDSLAIQNLLQWLGSFAFQVQETTQSRKEETPDLIAALTDNLDDLEQEKLRLESLQRGEIPSNQLDAVAASVKTAIIEKQIKEGNQLLLQVYQRVFPEIGNTQALNNTSLRRVLRAELLEMGDILRRSDLQDELTNTLRLWHRNFQASLSEVAIEDVKEKFIKLLQEALIDPLSLLHPDFLTNPQIRLTLDDKPVLGSNGKTYNRKALCIFMSHFPEDKQETTLQDLMNAEVFIVQRHPVAEFMVRWLKKFNPSFFQTETALRIETLYKKLEEEFAVPLLPSLANAKLREIKAIERARSQEEAKANAAVAKEVLKTKEEVFQSFLEENASLFAEGEKMFIRQKERLACVARALAIGREAIQAKLAALPAKQQEVRAQIPLLQERVQRVDVLIQEAEAGNQRLAEKIEQVQRQIQENRENAKSDPFKTIAIAVACAVITWGASSVLQAAATAGQAAATSVTAAPIQGGASFSLTWAI